MRTPTLLRWCVRCDLPEHRWDRSHPLYSDGSPDCPDCTQADVELEAAQKRRDDR